jgi:adenosylcobyric acid synthase
VDLPYLANFTDLDALAREPDVQLLRVNRATDQSFDAIILPGTKNTAHGLRFLQERGIARVLRRVLAEGGAVVGLCGGYQMLGRRILDPNGVESSYREIEGLGLLDAVTIFERTKVTVQVSGVHRASGCRIEGYEVHMGRTETRDVVPLLEVSSACDTAPRGEGAVSLDGRVMGTYVHGLFDAPAFRRVFLNGLREARGKPPLEPIESGSLDADLDRLADLVADHLDVPAVERVIERGL